MADMVTADADREGLEDSEGGGFGVYCENGEKRITNSQKSL